MNFNLMVEVDKKTKVNCVHQTNNIIGFGGPGLRKT